MLGQDNGNQFRYAWGEELLHLLLTRSEDVAKYELGIGSAPLLPQPQQKYLGVLLELGL